MRLASLTQPNGRNRGGHERDRPLRLRECFQQLWIHWDASRGNGAENRGTWLHRQIRPAGNAIHRPPLCRLIQLAERTAQIGRGDERKMFILFPAVLPAPPLRG